MNWIMTLLKQPSTWRGIILIATAAGWAITEEQSEAVIAAGIALAGVVGAFTHD